MLGLGVGELAAHLRGLDMAVRCGEHWGRSATGSGSFVSAVAEPPSPEGPRHHLLLFLAQYRLTDINTKLCLAFKGSEDQGGRRAATHARR